MNYLIKKYSCWIICLLPLLATAQIPTVRIDGFFLQDSVELGRSVKFVLLSKHSAEAEVVFPDTTFKFAPFELVRKDFFPTRTQGGVSTDSTIYTLRTFSLQPVQSLQLNARLFLNGDTLQLTTRPDTVKLIQRVKQVPDRLPLKASTQLQYVAEEFNYIYWGLGLAAAAVFIGSIWVLFRNRIVNRYHLYMMSRDQRNFQSRFNSAKQRFSRQKTLEPLERAITVWKNYLAKLEEQEINSFTTKEIATFYQEDEQLGNALKSCDRAIYGNLIADNVTEVEDALKELATFARDRYVLLRDSLRNVASTR